MHACEWVASQRMKYTCGICERQRERERARWDTWKWILSAACIQKQYVCTMCAESGVYSLALCFIRSSHYRSVCACVRARERSSAFVCVCIAFVLCCLVFIKFSLYKFCGNYLAGCEFFLLFMRLFLTPFICFAWMDCTAHTYSCGGTYYVYMYEALRHGLCARH